MPQMYYNEKKPPQRLPIFHTMTTLDKEIRTRVAPDIKNAFSDMAKQKGLTESEFLRSIVLNTINQPSHTPKIENDTDIEMAELKIRLPKFLITAAKERAGNHGMAVSKWIKSLVQSNLIKTPVLFDDVVLVIKKTDRELAAVGNNLNQIARKFNESGFEPDLVKVEKLNEVKQEVKQVRKAIDNLIRVSCNGWIGFNEN